MFAGDKADMARRNLKTLLQSRYGKTAERYEGEGFDMEPFEVLRDLVSASDTNDSIGGAPQLVKVYQHMNARAVGVYWPTKKPAK